MGMKLNPLNHDITMFYTKYLDKNMDSVNICQWRTSVLNEIVLGLTVSIPQQTRILKFNVENWSVKGTQNYIFILNIKN